MTRRRSTTRQPAEAQFVVITGMSGAGKSQAIRALEDLGYYCVDNLPVVLIPTFADLILQGRGESRRAGVVVDIREGAALAKFPAVYRALTRRYGPRVRLLFLEASDETLIRRFSETRRPHPLGTALSVPEGVQEERQRLVPMRRLADRVLDTSQLTVHELRRSILGSMGGDSETAPLAVTILSFGFRRGLPPDADLVFDVRFLPNPHFVPALRPWTGRDARVARYVLRAPAARRFLTLTHAMLRFLLPHYITEGKSYLTVAIGCTGGRHRSVALAEAIGRRLRRTRGIRLVVRHRDVREE